MPARPFHSSTTHSVDSHPSFGPVRSILLRYSLRLSNSGAPSAESSAFVPCNYFLNFSSDCLSQYKSAFEVPDTSLEAPVSTLAVVFLDSVSSEVLPHLSLPSVLVPWALIAFLGLALRKEGPTLPASTLGCKGFVDNRCFHRASTLLGFR